MTEHISLSEARRIALAAQGFDRPRPRRSPGAGDLRRVLRRQGLVQIDFVNVLAPAHYMIPFSRVGPYDKAVFDRLVYASGEFTEQWAHEASIVPVETWPLLRHRMEKHRVRPWGFEKFIAKNPGYVAGVLAEVRARGPLGAEHVTPHETTTRIPGAWHASVSRAVLEAYFGQGLLAVTTRRPDFSRLYDLAERVIAAAHHQRKVEREEAQRELLRLAARSHGIGTVADLANYYHIPVTQARPRIAELAAAGELREVRVEGWREPAWLHPKAQCPARIEAATLLSPFDPVVWFRPRAERLYGFHYRIEIFVPQEKRKWGYYVLPFLLGDRLVARADLKADRVGRRLLVLAAWVEPHARAAAVAGPLATELRAMAHWLKLESVIVSPRGNLARKLALCFR